MVERQLAAAKSGGGRTLLSDHDRLESLSSPPRGWYWVIKLTQPPVAWRNDPVYPEKFALHGAHPNPFNPTTTIRFEVLAEIGGARPVRLGIYDVGGRLVRELVRGSMETGEVAVNWDGRSQQGRRLVSGTYFVRLEVAGEVLTGKLVMLK